MKHFSPLDIFSRTLYGEARGELAPYGERALLAIGHVILNRLESKSWFGSSVEAVCLKPNQFSCWNPTDPNFKMITQNNILDRVYTLCERLARSLMTISPRSDFTNGANHYHHQSIKPFWCLKKKPTLTIGNHIFYKL
ncbi:MAG: hypothetical protein CNLJKLNK_01247 [Holosporales bacterium]